MSKGRTVTSHKKITERKPKKKAETTTLIPAVKIPVAETIATELAIEKTQEFSTFLKWVSLPEVLKGKPVEELKEIGIADPEIHDLLSIKTRVEFAERYHLRPATLTEWKQKLDNANILADSRAFFKALTPNVYHALYKGILKSNGDAHRVRLWEEIFNEKPGPGGGSPTAPTLIQKNEIRTVIISLGQEFDQKLRKAYEQIIERGEVQSVGGVHPNPAAQGGGEQSR